MSDPRGPGDLNTGVTPSQVGVKSRMKLSTLSTRSGRWNLTSVLTWAALGLAVLLAAPAFGQNQRMTTPDNRLPLPMDWSFSHVIHTKNFTAEQAARMRTDPRLYHS